MRGRFAALHGGRAARARVHDVAEPDEFEKLGQATVRPVEQEPTSAPGHGDLQSCQRIHGGAIGWHQPRDIEIDGFVTGGRRRRCRRAGPSATISQALVHVIRHPQRSLPVWRAEALQKELRPRSKVVTLAEERLQSDVTHPPHLIAKSEFFRRPLPRDAIAALVDAFSHERVTGESRESDFMPWGGAYNRVRPDATAFVHRSELFQLKHAVVVDPPPTTSAAAAAHRWVVRSWMSVHRGDRGGCSGTSPIRTLRIGQTPTTARTVTAWCTSRPDTTPGTSSGFTSRFGRGRAVARVSRVCQRRSSV
jgi:hypothetical protein